MLKAEGISLCYGAETVFTDLNVTIPAGESLAVVGKSGCGKSSLLYVLSGLRKPSAGRVTFAETDLWQVGTERHTIRRRSFGFIFQQHFLINYLTVLENVLVPSFQPEQMLEAARCLLTFLGIEKCESKFPYELSGGQRQRAAVARALINNPKVLFADEPTASLDTENSQAVISLLQTYQQMHNTSLVLVTHDLNLANGFRQTLNLTA